MSTRIILAALLVASALSAPALAQQAAPPPGSPAATMTIPGDQLPPPPQKFGGKIERDARNSTPFWPARVVPPKQAEAQGLGLVDRVKFVQQCVQQ